VPRSDVSGPWQGGVFVGGSALRHGPRTDLPSPERTSPACAVGFGWFCPLQI
jgi:hypothetical protein